jgi:hypothetical protein
MDWCFYPNKEEVALRKSYDKENFYKDIWFSFNEKYSFTNQAFKSINEKFKKEVKMGRPKKVQVAAQEPVDVPKKFSMNGYSFKTWAVKNKEFLKSIASLILGTSGFLISSTGGLKSMWSTLIAGLSAVLLRCILDGLDYWQADP